MNTAAAQTIYSIKGEYQKSPFYRRLVPDIETVFNTIRVEVHRRMRRLLSSPLSESGLVVHRATVDSKARLAVQRMGEEMEKRGAAVSENHPVWGPRGRGEASRGSLMLTPGCWSRTYSTGRSRWRRT